MNRRLLWTLLTSVFVLGVLVTPVTHVNADDTPKLVGAKKCKMCHQKEEDGAQYAKWEAARHSKAYETLATEAAIATAKKLGIDDPQKSEQCLRCHATAFVVMDDLANQKIKLEEGVSCEGCHGAGGDYYKKKTMEAVTAGTIKAEDVGLIHPTEAVCVTCHTAEGNPNFKGFDFEKAVAKIAHPIPAAPTTGK